MSKCAEEFAEFEAAGWCAASNADDGALLLSIGGVDDDSAKLSPDEVRALRDGYWVSLRRGL